MARARAASTTNVLPLFYALANILLQSSTDQLANLTTAVILLLVVIFLLVLVVLILVAVWMYHDCKQRGETPGIWVTLFVAIAFIPGIGLIGSIVVLIVYLLMRNKTITFDRQGNPLLPNAPPTGWTPTMANAFGSPAPLGQPVPGWSPPGPPPVLSRVKCPHCQTIFPYQKNRAGRSHVKCPSCGNEGTI